jgi:pyruvate dehydrogenase E1 component alpha subunit
MRPQDWHSLYYWMVMTRLFDEKGKTLARLGRTAVYYPSTGEEAAVIGTAYAMAAHDWIFPYYRQQGAYLLRGTPLKAMFGELLGNAADITLGHQSPIHYSYAHGHVVSNSSPIGSQVSQAVGAAMAARLKNHAVVLTYVGDGGTSSNDFHAGMTFAGVFQAPLVVACVNNQWAISCPVTRQTALPRLADKAPAYGFEGIQVDGNDAVAVYQATQQAVERARNGGGPQFLELLTYRVGGHSTADNAQRYRDDTLVPLPDPVPRLRDRMITEGLWDLERDQALWEEIRQTIQRGLAEAEAAGDLTTDSLFEQVYAEAPPALLRQRDAWRYPQPNAEIPINIQRIEALNPPMT